jgi:hypothetical protein
MQKIPSLPFLWFALLVVVSVPVMGDTAVPLRRVNSVSDLRTLTSFGDTDAIEVLGFSVPGDGGGGTWYWDALSTGREDFGTVCAATNRPAGRWKRVYSGPLNIRWFGAAETGDASGAIQQTIDKAADSGASVFIPNGVYTVSQGLYLPEHVSMLLSGEDFTKSIIRCGTNMSNVLTIGTSAYPPGTQALTISQLSIDGNNQAQCGIYGGSVQDSTFYRIRIKGTLRDGLALGSGWRNQILSSEIRDNVGNGIHLHNNEARGGNNAVRIFNTHVFSNGGIGLYGGYGSDLLVEGCNFDVNRACGVMLVSARALALRNNYFEQNGIDGLVFKTPPRRLKTDVLLTGSTDSNVWHGAYGSKGAVIEANHFDNPKADAFITLLGAQGAVIEANECDYQQIIPLILTPCDSALARVESVRVFGNIGVGSTLALANLGPGLNALLSTWDIDDVPKGNYISESALAWSGLKGTSVGTIARGDLSFNGSPTILLTNAVGSSEIFGQALNLAEYPELHNKPVYFGAWIKQSTNAVAAAYIQSTGRGAASVSTESTWRWIEMQSVLPSAGRVDVGIQLLSGTPSASLYIARPILACIGAHRNSFYRSPHSPEWQSPFAPTNGTWNIGDRVWNRLPGPGAPVAWICTSGGTPGRWIEIGGSPE